jgi:hypothetical protein
MSTDPVYVLPRIPYLRLRVTLRAQRDATLPAYKGSMLRGAFGHALRKVVCMMPPEQPCESCLLRPVCYFTKLFDPFSTTPPPPFLQGLPITPRPYTFEPAGHPPTSQERHLAAGEALKFDLLLFGQATDLQIYALLAIERMAVAGLGRHRSPFRLERVLCRKPDGSWRSVLEDGRMHGHSGSRPSFPETNGIDHSRAVLHFLTPTRLRVEHDHVETTTFPELAEAMLRRVMEVAWFHVTNPQIDWQVERLLARAQEVRIVRSELRWQDWERYNVQQKTLMNMGGFTGSVEIEGDLEPFAPLFRAAEIVHVGRGTPFGLGRMEVGPS